MQIIKRIAISWSINFIAHPLKFSVQQWENHYYMFPEVYKANTPFYLINKEFPHFLKISEAIYL